MNVRCVVGWCECVSNKFCEVGRVRNVERDLSEVALAANVIRIFSDSLNGWAKHLKGDR